MNFFVEQVADITDILKTVYNELVEHRTEYNNIFGLSTKQEILSYGYDEIEKMFPELRSYTRSGWFHYNQDHWEKQQHCQNWHIDQPAKHIKRLFLAAWPTPTQYYNKKPNRGEANLLGFNGVICNDGDNDYNRIFEEKYIKNMETGILYCCSWNLIHRSQPGSVDQPRLLFRWAEFK